MIDAKELRIGNYVYQKCDDEYREVNWFDIRNIDNRKADVKYEVEAEDLEPIPLTPEILVDACGFADYKNDHSYDYWGNNGDDSDLFLCIDWRRREDGFTPYIKSLEFECIGISIKHLHQLQNLYFALTGEELPIDINKIKTATTHQ